MERKNYKEARLSLGWSQQRLADEAGVGITTVQNYEYGTWRNPYAASTIRRALIIAGAKID